MSTTRNVNHTVASHIYTYTHIPTASQKEVQDNQTFVIYCIRVFNLVTQSNTKSLILYSKFKGSLIPHHKQSSTLQQALRTHNYQLLQSSKELNKAIDNNKCKAQFNDSIANLLEYSHLDNEPFLSINWPNKRTAYKQACHSAAISNRVLASYRQINKTK